MRPPGLENEMTISDDLMDELQGGKTQVQWLKPNV